MPNSLRPVQSILASLDSCNQASMFWLTIVDRTNLPKQPVDVLKKRIKGGKPQNSTRLSVSASLCHETFLISTFQNDAFLKKLRYYPTTYEAEMFPPNVLPNKEERITFFWYSSTSRELYLGSARSTETQLA